MVDKNKNNYLWIGIAVVAVIVLAIVLTSNLNNNSQNEITCNSPYIKVGTSCCLDQNYNGVCDNDETPTQNLNYCDKINKPTLSLSCQNKTGDTYYYCALKIGHDSRDDGLVSYLAYVTSSYDATIKGQVYGNQQLPFSWWDVPTGTTIPMSAFDNYGYYFEGLIPDAISDGFLVIPHDFENEVDCTNLEVGIQFQDAKLLS